jgi:DNA-binding transcriptional ArsR family regulator
MDAPIRRNRAAGPHVGAVAGRAEKAGSGLESLADQAAAAARMLKLIGNERRLLILCALVANGEMRVGELVHVVRLSNSALSQHLARLRADGLVAFRRQSQALHYRVSDPRAARILKLLKTIYCDGRA